VSAHDDEVELALPRHRREVTEDPLDASTRLCLLEHPEGGIETAQSAAVTGLAGAVQQGAGSAADVEHGVGAHHKLQIEREVVSFLPGAERFVQRGEARVGESTIDHGIDASRSRPPTSTENVVGTLDRDTRSDR
jgi:hypothetical protein